MPKTPPQFGQQGQAKTLVFAFVRRLDQLVATAARVTASSTPISFACPVAPLLRSSDLAHCSTRSIDNDPSLPLLKRNPIASSADPREVSESRMCKGCSGVLAPDSQFCGSCGTAVVTPEAASRQGKYEGGVSAPLASSHLAAGSITPRSIVASTPMSAVSRPASLCPRCGQRAGDGPYCGGCGQQLGIGGAPLSGGNVAVSRGLVGRPVMPLQGLGIRRERANSTEDIEKWISVGLSVVGVILVAIGIYLLGVTQINLLTGNVSNPYLGEGIGLIVVAVGLFAAAGWLAAKW